MPFHYFPFFAPRKFSKLQENRQRSKEASSTFNLHQSFFSTVILVYWTCSTKGKSNSVGYLTGMWTAANSLWVVTSGIPGHWTSSQACGVSPPRPQQGTVLHGEALWNSYASFSLFLGTNLPSSENDEHLRTHAFGFNLICKSEHCLELIMGSTVPQWRSRKPA